MCIAVFCLSNRRKHLLRVLHYTKKRNGFEIYLWQFRFLTHQGICCHDIPLLARWMKTLRTYTDDVKYVDTYDNLSHRIVPTYGRMTATMAGHLVIETAPERALKRPHLTASTSRRSC